jgi:hypothetical protein
LLWRRFLPSEVVAYRGFILPGARILLRAVVPEVSKWVRMKFQDIAEFGGSSHRQLLGKSDLEEQSHSIRTVNLRSLLELTVRCKKGSYPNRRFRKVTHWLATKLLLVLASTVILDSESHGTHDRITVCRAVAMQRPRDWRIYHGLF